MDDMKKTVTVLSRNYSTGLGVIRSLGAAGYDVELIASVRKKGSSAIASGSRYVKYTAEILSPDIQKDDGSELKAALVERARDKKAKTVLFPTDDFTASVCALYADELGEYYYLPRVCADAPYTVSQLMDKTVQAKLAEKAGLCVPRQVKLELDGEITLPDDMPYPCFVKPLMSIKGQKSEMARCDSASELKAKLNAMQSANPHRAVLVQEYLDITREYDLSGVSLLNEVILPAVIEKTRIARHEKGVTLAGKLIPWVTVGNGAEAKVRAFIKSLGYVGMFDMELFLCGDKLYFGEVNLRSGGPNYAYFLSGVNLPELVVSDLTGEDNKNAPRCVREYGRSFVYEKVAWEDFIYRHINRRQLRECLLSADDGLLCRSSDKGPGRVFRRRIVLSAIKHRLLLLSGREKRAEKEEEAPEPVVVTGRNWLNNLSAVRALGKAGYRVRVLRIFKTKPKRANLLRRMRPEKHSVYTECYKEVTATSPDALYNALASLAEKRKKLLIYPTDDYAAFSCDADRERLAKLFILPGIEGKTGIGQLMDKNEQKKLAGAFGLPVLSAVLIQHTDDGYNIPDGVKYPCFVKPNVSIKSNKARMRRCDNEEELKALLSGCDCDMLCEELAEISEEYSVLGAAAGGKLTAPCVFKTLTGGSRERKGVAVSGVTVSADTLGDLPKKCAELIGSLGYTGLYDIDLIKTEDGKLYFTEINFRAGASVHAFTQSGANLPAELADCLVKGAALRETEPLTYGKSFVSEKVLMEEFARGDVSARRISELMKGSDIHFVKDAADPRPYRYFKLFYAFAALLRTINAIKHR